MRRLLPRIHGLLVLLLCLEEQHIKHSDVADMAVLLEHGAHLCPEHGRRHIERVERTNLGSLV